MRILIPIKELAPKLKYLDIEDFKTGDIIAVSNNKMVNKLIHSLSGNNWVHSGIIYVDPKTKLKYVLEGARYGDEKRSLFNKILISKWLTINRYSKICIMRLRGSLNPKILYSKFKSFIKNSYIGKINYTWLRFITKSPYKKYSEEEYKRDFTCVEATIKTLQEVGVFDTQYSESSYLLENILRRQIKCKNGFSYDEPYQICLGRPYVRGYIKD